MINKRLVRLTKIHFTAIDQLCKHEEACLDYKVSFLMAVTDRPAAQIRHVFQHEAEVEKILTQLMAEDQVIIMRSPVLMEDEGRHQTVKLCSRQEALFWIAEQKGQYFGPGDYYIAEVPNR